MAISFELLTDGGVLMGDDWEWPGLSEVVKDFAEKNEKTVSFISRKNRGYSTWFIIKEINF